MSTKLHNRIQTHIDNYSGEIITTDGKPPVNAKLTNFKMYGKSVQNGVPTPEIPISIESIAHDVSLISCGSNMWRNNVSMPLTQHGYTLSYDTKSGVYTFNGTASIGNVYIRPFSGSLAPVKAGDKITMIIQYISGTCRDSADSSVKKSITVLGYNSLNNVNSWVGDEEVGEAKAYSKKTSTMTRDGMTHTMVWLTTHITMTDFKFKVGWYLNNDKETEIKPYTGSTTQLNLIGAPNAPAEWAGQPINLMSLPDGTADEYKADEGIVLAKNYMDTYVGTESWAPISTLDTGDYKAFYYDLRNTVKAPKKNNQTKNIISNRFKGLNAFDGNISNDNCIYGYSEPSGANWVVIKIDYNLLGVTDWTTLTNTEKSNAFKAWLSANNTNVIYVLEAPITIPVIPQPTPKSVYTHLNNIFTDSAVQPTISCGVRKLGNRPFIPTKLKDELSNFLVDENGNNIGGLY